MNRIVRFITNRDSSWKEEADSLLKSAGYHEFTVLQEKVIPLILKGKDVAVYTHNLQGKTASFIIPVLLNIRRDNKGIKALYIASTSGEVKKIFIEVNKFRIDKKILINALCDEDDTREKRNELAKRPDILTGTPMRIIDHIRRGDLEFPNLRYVIIDAQEQVNFTGFQEDIQFIFSKLPDRKQIIYFSNTVYRANGETTTNGLSFILKKTRIVTEEEIVSNAPHSYYETESGHKLNLLLMLIYARNIDSFLLFCNTEDETREVYNFLKENKIKAIIFDKGKEQSGTLSPKDNYLITTDKAVFNQALTWISYLINFNVPEDKDLYFKRLVYLSSNYKSVITLVTKSDYEKLQKIQETSKVSIRSETIPKTDDVTKGMITTILKKIKEEEDPDELNNFRLLVKKNVPLFLRSYFAAYLFKQIVDKDEGEGEVKTDNGNFTTLFISIGKNRHVYPKDLVNLLMSNLSIQRAEIGEIKILDNYSFVDISLEQAQKAIAKLSGMNFRRRRLTVNLARKKGE